MSETKTVPVEPTEEMIVAAIGLPDDGERPHYNLHRLEAISIYEAMLAAAPNTAPVEAMSDDDLIDFRDAHIREYGQYCDNSDFVMVARSILAAALTELEIERHERKLAQISTREREAKVAALEAFRDEVMGLCDSLTKDFVAVTVKAIHAKHFPEEQSGHE